MNTNRLSQPKILWKVLVALGLALVFMVLSPRPASAQESGACYTGLECTANDFQVAAWTVHGVLEDCYNTTKPNFMLVEFEVTISAAQADRYDPGLIISAGTWDVNSLTSNTCWREALFPATVAHPSTLNLFTSLTGFLNIDGDACGDLASADQAVLDLDPIWIECADHDGDTRLDVSVCVVYDNNTAGTCTTTTDLEPGTSSKCNCFYQEVGITPTAIEGLSFSASSQALPVGLALGGVGLVLIAGVLLSIYLRRRVNG